MRVEDDRVANPPALCHFEILSGCRAGEEVPRLYI